LGVCAGLLKDHTGGLLIVEMDNLEEAEEAAMNDPAVLDEKLSTSMGTIRRFVYGK